MPPSMCLFCFKQDFLCVAEYHLGKVRLEQMQPADSPLIVRDLCGGHQGICRALGFTALHVQFSYMLLIFADHLQLMIADVCRFLLALLLSVLLFESLPPR